jgi:protein-disulfide isomerase
MGKKRREAAQKAYSEAMKKQARRDKQIKIFGGLAVLAVVLFIVGVAVIASGQKDSDVLGSGEILVQPDASNAIPPSTFPSGDEVEFGVLYPYSGIENYNNNIPTLEVWLDYQCSACAEIEALSGETFKSLADQGKVNLVYRPTAFLDPNRRSDSSQRAINAWGCAIEENKGQEYKTLILSNQPTGGTRARWSNDDFFSFAQQAGLSGADLESFKTCVVEGRYLGWAANSTLAFELNNKTKTPTVVFDGVEVDNSITFNPEALVAYVEQNS